MEVSARARYVRVTPMKARRVVDLIRGLPATEALNVLRFARQAASEPVYKVLASAMANAENNERVDRDSLLVSQAYVDEGPTMKRFRPRAQMRAGRILKRTCHITVVVESVASTTRPKRRPRRTPNKAAPVSRKVTIEKASALKAPAKKAPHGGSVEKTTEQNKTSPKGSAE